MDEKETICPNCGVKIVAGISPNGISPSSAILTELPLIVGVLPAGPENSPTIPAETPPIPPQVASEPIIPAVEPIIPITPKTKEQAFIQALKIAVADKFDTLIVYCQCYHETDAFRKLVGEWNYAGCKVPQKAIPPVPIKSIEVWTHEVINGVLTKLKDTFADFNSADDFMKFYVWQIKRLYKESYENRNSPSAFFYWLTHGVNKWATDPNYSIKLEKLYADLRANGIYEKLNKLFA